MRAPLALSIFNSGLINPFGDTADQSVVAAAQAAAKFNNDNRLREEGQLVDFFRQQGLQVSTPDLEAFRSTVQAAYRRSDYAKVWPPGLLDQINQTR